MFRLSLRVPTVAGSLMRPPETHRPSGVGGRLGVAVAALIRPDLAAPILHSRVGVVAP